MIRSKIPSMRIIISLFILTTLIPLIEPTSVEQNSEEGLRLNNDDDDYFALKQTQKLPKKRKPIDQCEQVIKNGMICKVCKGSKKNEKYEQCSYASHPSKRIPKSRKDKLTFGQEDIEVNSPPAINHRTSKSPRNSDDDSFPKKKSSKLVRKPSKKSSVAKPSPSEYVSESERLSRKLDKDNCETVQKDTLTCMVCKDEQTGHNFERCSYTNHPEDEVYKYSKSKSVGHPKSTKPKLERSSSYKRSDDDEDDTSGGGGGGGDYDSSDFYGNFFGKTNRDDDDDEGDDEDESDSSQSKNTQLDDDKEYKNDSNGCKTVIKDSMTCQVCFDPETNENSEQCNYSYKPNDKVYAYTKERSFGTPKKH